MDKEKPPGPVPALKMMSFADARAARETYLAEIARLNYERMVRRGAGPTVRGSVESHNPDPRVKGGAWSGVIHNAGDQIEQAAAKPAETSAEANWRAAEALRFEYVLEAFSCAAQAAQMFKDLLDLAPPQSLRYVPGHPPRDVRETPAYLEAADLLKSAHSGAAYVSAKAKTGEGGKGDRVASGRHGDAEATFARLLAQLKREQGDPLAAPATYLRRPSLATAERKVLPGEYVTPDGMVAAKSDVRGHFTIRCSESGIGLKVELVQSGAVWLHVGQPNSFSRIRISPHDVQCLVKYFGELSAKAT